MRAEARRSHDSAVGPVGAPGRAEEQSPLDAAGATRVLFLGNSYVYVNDLPRTFAALAGALGVAAVVDAYAPGGYSLQQHAASAETRRRIEAAPWDVVVLQEQSQRSAFDEGQVAREVIPPALALDALIHERAPRARTAFYETWARRDGDASNCKQVPRVCTRDGMQRRVTETYADLGERTGGVVVPVGAAWQTTLRSHPEVNLYAADGSHPSPQGTYLAACVFVARLFGRSPIGAPALRVPSKEAEILQRVADETVRAASGSGQLDQGR